MSALRLFGWAEASERGGGFRMLHLIDAAELRTACGQSVRWEGWHFGVRELEPRPLGMCGNCALTLHVRAAAEEHGDESC